MNKPFKKNIQGNNPEKKPSENIIPQVENSTFSKLEREFNSYSEYLDKQCIGVMNIKRELLRKQEQMCERFEKAEKERDQAKESIERLIIRLLNISDELKMENIKEHREKPTSQILENVRQCLLDAVKKEGVKLMEIKEGDIYNPNTCDATPGPINNNSPTNTIVKVVSPGYEWREDHRKIRNAKVEVSTKKEVAKQ